MKKLSKEERDLLDRLRKAIYDELDRFYSSLEGIINQQTLRAISKCRGLITTVKLPEEKEE